MDVKQCVCYSFVDSKLYKELKREKNIATRYWSNCKKQMSRRKYIKTSKSAELDRMLVELFRQLWCDRVKIVRKGVNGKGAVLQYACDYS